MTTPQHASLATRFADLAPRRADWSLMRRSPQRNLVAGLTVAIVALPLALAFGAASGLGAQAGLVTAVVAGIIAALFGGSNLQVSGPTGAMTVVLIPVVHEFGTTGVLMVGAMAGLILIAMALAKLGRYVRYLPVSVIEGFTAGIAVVIALQQVPAALGIADAAGEQVWRRAADAVGSWAHAPQLTPPLIALGVAALILGGARWRPGAPFSLLGIALATVFAKLTTTDLTPLGDIPAGLPAPSLAFVDVSAISTFLSAALAIAALAALESLLCATVADGMSVNEQHDPDRELFGQGLANLASPIFGGIPATAAIARTAVNVRAGATSRLAAVSHALILLVVIYAASPLVSEIPLSALAGVLFATTIRMIEVSSLRSIMRATRADAIIVALTFGVTVAVDLVTAVAVGIGVAILLALQSIARTANVDQQPLEAGDHSEEVYALLSEHIVAFRLDGPLFFGAAHKFLLEILKITDVRIVILRMSRVTTLDATGGRILGDAISRLEARGILVLLSGIATGHDDVLAALGVAAHLRRDGLIFRDTPAAIRHAHERLDEQLQAGSRAEP